MKTNNFILIIFLIFLIIIISGFAGTGTGNAVFDKGYFSRQREQTGPVPITVGSSIAATDIVYKSMQMRNAILDYLPHPYDYRVRDIDRVKLIQARMNILETTMAQYYARGSSLSCDGNEFFDLDMEAIYNLAQLACIAQPKVPTGYEPRTVTVEIDGELYTATENEGLCNSYLRDIARNAISELIESERILLIATMKSTPCEVDATEFALSMSLAEENIENLRIDRVADNYRSAFTKAMRCYCDW